MTLRERGKLGNAAIARAAAERAERMRLLLSQGECLKRAAWRVGVSYRTARRYRKGGR
jgi:hypothetical protein